MGELVKRVIVAVVALPLLGLLIVHGAWTSAIVFAAAAALACWEYYRMVFGSVPAVAWLAIACGAAMAIVPASGASDRGTLLLAIVAATSMLVWIDHLFRGPHASAPGRIGHITAGLLFCSLGPVALTALRATADGIAWAALVLVAGWANDSAAYLVGRAIGRHKLSSEISPYKTWEGFFGGLGGGVLALSLLRPWLPPYLGTGACVTLGLVAGVFGPLGDLSKSMLKRAYGVKDASHIIPGHGGILDRIDSLLFTAPLVWILRVTLFRR